MGTAGLGLSRRVSWQSREPWKEKEVSPKQQTGGCKWSEKGNSPEAEAASHTAVPAMLPASGEARA